MSDFKKLIVKFADGRKICNCGEAYLSPCASGIDREGRNRTDMLACKDGCSVNQINAKEYIASRVVELLPTV